MNRSHRNTALTLLLLIPILLCTSAGSSQESPKPAAAKWLGPDGRPLPFESDEQLLEFLRTAKVMAIRNLSRGITAPQRVELEKDGVRANGHFNFANEEKMVATMRTGETVLNFRDHHMFQGAAYELARMLGLRNVPPVVPRKVGGKSGSLSIWIEGAITERERIARKINPKDVDRWMKQVMVMKIFDALIFNTDRTQENILMDSTGMLWMIDHTRAFRREDKISNEDSITQCDRKLWQRLKALDGGEVRERLKPFLRGPEIDGVLRRRDKLVAHFEGLISSRGEQAVLFDLP